METKYLNLYGPDNNHKCAEWVEEEMDLESVLCPINKGHQHVGKRLTDLSVCLPDKHVEDFVWTWLSESLIQDHVLSFLKKQHFTGFEVKPVKARFKRQSAESPPKLWELVVTGWGGLAPPESGIKLTYRCEACGYTRYSGFSRPEKLIDETQWDGSDFFIVWPLPKYIFVTNRVAQAIEHQGFTGAHFFAPADLKPTEGHAAAHLSHVMPEQRAREIGEPLGIY